MQEKEIWKDVFGYKGLYKVSSFGRIESLDRIINHPSGSKMFRYGVILAQMDDKDGYKKVKLSKNGDVEQLKVHRIECIAFHPNPLNKPQVNHKDGIKWNNFEWNLEWVTEKENVTHAWDLGLMNPKTIAVNQLSKSGEFLNEFNSIKLAEEKTGTQNAHISAVCKNKRNYAGGFKWEYK